MVYCITNAPLKLHITAPSSDIQQSFIPVMQQSNNS